jgi:hypothetical protein
MGLEFKCQIENQASYYRLLNITGVLGEFKQEEIRTHTYTHTYIWEKSYCLKFTVLEVVTFLKSKYAINQLKEKFHPETRNIC